MKILALTYFDPASVILSHRNMMRDAGHDFRLASVRAYTTRQEGADWLLEKLSDSAVLPDGRFKLSFDYVTGQQADLKSLHEFAETADVVQFHPGIGEGSGDWASHTGLVDQSFLDKELGEVIHRLKVFRAIEAKIIVYFIHGSVNTWANLKLHKDNRYNHFLAASTLDYATELNATYLPPLINPGHDWPMAPLRGDYEPLTIAHTPSDRDACHTETFMKLSFEAGCLPVVKDKISHDEVIALKAKCNAGFDHLRGAFSTNTLEHAALGMVPLVGLKRNYLDRFLDIGGSLPPWQELCKNGIETEDDLVVAMRTLESNPELTRRLQIYAAKWWADNFSRGSLTNRLLAFYEKELSL